MHPGMRGRPCMSEIVDHILYTIAGWRESRLSNWIPGEALSTHPEPYRHHCPRRTPLSGGTYRRGLRSGRVIHTMVMHCVSRYRERLSARREDWNVE